MTSSDLLLERLAKLHPRVIDLALDRIERLLAALGNPHQKLPPVIHVAGTNGKGSLVAYLRAMLEAAGYTVHAYTSPHLVHFHERIRLPGGPIGEAQLAAILEECERVNDGALITIFEIITAAAFLAFARHPADILLLEVGLGGRYDATNVIARPAVTAITPVGIDHTQFFGTVLEDIAAEKAGISKRGVPVVVGRQRRAAEMVIERIARELDAPLARLDADWTWWPLANRHWHYESARHDFELPPPGLAGPHQFDNAATAIACIEQLSGFKVPEAAIIAGVQKVEWPARLQHLTRGPLVERLPQGCELWLDGGHNEDCGIALAGMAQEWRRADKLKLHLIFGMLTTKDASGFVAPLKPFAASAHSVAIPGHASYSAREAADQAIKIGLACAPAESIEAAIDDVVRGLSGPARILICGSLYLAGEVLKENG